ncbi:MAG: type II toxin-antitoxin system HicA family toxin [Bryobacteraceae bacterium]
MVRILRRNGFEHVSSAGSHQKWRNRGTGKQVIVAYRRGSIVPLGTMKAIVDGSGIPLDSWRE